MKQILILILLFTLASCTNSKGATKVLSEQGYTEIRTTGFDFWAKGKDDWSSTGFEAVTPTGKRVKGAVTDKGVFAFLRPRWNIRIWKVDKE